MSGHFGLQVLTNAVNLQQGQHVGHSDQDHLALGYNLVLGCKSDLLQVHPTVRNSAQIPRKRARLTMVITELKFTFLTWIARTSREADWDSFD